MELQCEHGGKSNVPIRLSTKTCRLIEDVEDKLLKFSPRHYYQVKYTNSPTEWTIPHGTTKLNVDNFNARLHRAGWEEPGSNDGLSS